MNNLIVIFSILIITTIPILGQNPDYYVNTISENSKFSGNRHMRDEFKNGITNLVIELNNGNNAKIDSMSIYNSLGQECILKFTYENDKIINYIMHAPGEFNYEPFYKTVYKYNSNGYIITELEKKWDNGIWKDSYSRNYLYDLNGRVILILGKLWRSNKWCDVFKEDLEYNDETNTSLSKIAVWNNEWVYTLKTKELYENDQLVLSFINEFVNGKWEKLFKQIFSYLDFGKRKSVLTYRWNNGSWVNLYNTTYLYSVLGDEVIMLFEDWKDNIWVNNSRYVYFLNKDKYLEYGFFNVWKNNRWCDEDGYVKVDNPDGFLFVTIAHEVFISYRNLTNVDINTPQIVKKIILHQNYPNPFNPITNIRYQIPEESFVELVIYNSIGEKIKSIVSEYQIKGEHNISFNARDLPSGLYLYKINADEFSEIKKMLLIK